MSSSSATRSRARLTEVSISRLRARETRYDVYDGAVAGLAVRVGKSGSKAFALYYRANRRLRCATLGRVGVLTLDQARKRAKVMLGKAADGNDPLAAKELAKNDLTVNQVAKQWLADLDRRKKARTMRGYRSAVTKHVAPRLGGRAIGSIDTKDVATLHMRLRATPYLANRVVSALSSMMSWCERRGLREQGKNPCRLIERFSETPRKRYLTDVEYARLGRAIREAESSGSISPIPLMAIKLMLLTGCRPIEVLTLRRPMVDLDSGVFRLGDSKTGPKTVFLPPEAVELLRNWPRFAGTDYVLPGTGRRKRGTHLVNYSRAWAKLCKAAKLVDCRPYDARHSFASVALSSGGHSLGVIGELLGHNQAATTKRYSHLHEEAAKKAATTTGGTIAAALSAEVKP